ncbi:hypothetical protein ACVWZB_004796 [Paenibacillus polymyxa]
MSVNSKDMAKIIYLINKEITNIQSDISQLEQFEKNGYQPFTVNPNEKYEQLQEYQGLLNRVKRLNVG